MKPAHDERVRGTAFTCVIAADVFKVGILTVDRGPWPVEICICKVDRVTNKKQITLPVICAEYRVHMAGDKSEN